MQYYFNSRDLACKNPFGAVTDATETEFTLFAQDGVFVNGVYFVLTKDGESPVYYPMSFYCSDKRRSLFKLKLTIDEPGLYWYHFNVITENGAFSLFKDLNGFAAEYAADEFQLTVFSKDFKTPEFIEGGMIYHIFVDRFNRGGDAQAVFRKKGVLKEWGETPTVADGDGVYRANDFYGGNFQGIIDKLDYLKDLGVTLVYLSPIFKSASNHRYDTGDYLKVDELLGTEEKFAELLREAKARGMEIMLDGVFNHTGADSLYFNKFGSYPSVGAYQSKRSPYYGWYTFSRYPDEYDCWWGITVTPTVKKPCDGFERLVLGEGGVIEKYMRLGVKAWRLDVVDELNSAFVKDLRRAIKARDKDALLIGEVWEDASNKISYGERREYFLGGQLDSVMNYPFKKAIIDFLFTGDKEAFAAGVSSVLENYPAPVINALMNVIGTHDTWRILNVCAALDVKNLDKRARAGVTIDGETRVRCLPKLKIAATLQFTLPGIPSLYYGDELGLDGYEDPLNRKTMPWKDYDKNIYGFYRRLTGVRKEFKRYFKGGFEFVSHEDLLIFRRYCEHDFISVVCNNTCGDKTLALAGDTVDLLTGEEYPAGENTVGAQKILILAKKNHKNR